MPYKPKGWTHGVRRDNYGCLWITLDDLHFDMLINNPNKSVRYGNQELKSKPHDFPWNGHSFYLRAEICTLDLDLTRDERNDCEIWVFLPVLSPFPWYGSPWCAASVFSAPLVWFGHIWHSCSLVNTSPNSGHLENLLQTPVFVSYNPRIQCTYLYTHSKINTLVAWTTAVFVLR